MMCGELGGKKERNKERKRRKSTRILPWHRYRFHVPGSIFLWNIMLLDRLLALPVLSVLRRLINSVPDFKHSMTRFQE